MNVFLEELSDDEVVMHTVNKSPDEYSLVLSGRDEYPESNGHYTYDGQENGKPKWSKPVEGGMGKLYWTGQKWSLLCEGWTANGPEATDHTPVPPFAGYFVMRDKINSNPSDVKVRYEKHTRPRNQQAESMGGNNAFFPTFTKYQKWQEETRNFGATR